jgi:alkylhydroperoxidase family enzyme
MNDVNERFRSLVVASADSRDEYVRHRRVLRVINAMRKWDEPETKTKVWYKYEQNLHVRRVKAHRASTMAVALAEQSAYNAKQEQKQAVAALDIYAPYKQQVRAEIDGWRQKVVEGRMTIAEFDRREREAMAYTRKLVRVHAEMLALRKTVL